MNAHVLTAGELGVVLLVALVVVAGACAGMVAQERHSKRGDQ